MEGRERDCRVNWRRWIKDALCFIGLGSWLIEYCCKCGVRQWIVWWCDDQDLWMRVGNEYGVLCPKCFSDEAEARGVFLRWYPRDETERARQ